MGWVETDITHESDDATRHIPETSGATRNNFGNTGEREHGDASGCSGAGTERFHCSRGKPYAFRPPKARRIW